MCLRCNLQLGPQLQCDLHSKLLGKCHEFAHFSGAFMQCLQLEQDVALYFLQWLKAAAPTCYGHPSPQLAQVSLQE